MRLQLDAAEARQIWELYNAVFVGDALPTDEMFTNEAVLDGRVVGRQPLV